MFKCLLGLRWRKHFGREGSRQRLSEMSEWEALRELIRPKFRSYVTVEIVERALAATGDDAAQTKRDHSSRDAAGHQ
jgi:hypothetical protein